MSSLKVGASSLSSIAFVSSAFAAASASICSASSLHPSLISDLIAHRSLGDILFMDDSRCLDLVSHSNYWWWLMGGESYK